MHNDEIAELEAEKPGNRRKPRADFPRQRYPLEFKLKVVNETFADGASVAGVARRRGLNANIVFRWRKQLREGRLGKGLLPGGAGWKAAGFVPVHVAEDAVPVPLLPAPAKPDAGSGVAAVPMSAAAGPGLIEIETPRGVKLRLSGRVDDRALRRILAAIRRLA